MKRVKFNLRKVVTIVACLAVTIGAKAQNITLNNGDNITYDMALTGNMQVTVSTGTATISGVISGAFNVTKAGAGTLVLTGSNTYSGSTTISGGKLQIGNGATAGSITSTSGVSIASGANLTFNRSNIVSFSKVISGAGTVTKAGTGSLYFTAGNTYTGLTTVSAGSLYIGSGSTVGSIAGNTSVAANATLVFARSDNYTYSGVISGAGNVSKEGTGVLNLSGVNTYTGKTTVEYGTLSIASTGSILNTSGIALTLATSEISFNNTAASAYSMPVTGLGKVTKAGAGELTLTNAQYTGATTINGGAVQFQQSATVPTSGIVTTASGNVAFNIPAGATAQYDGVVSGAGMLYKRGAGKLILTAANTYSGMTPVQNGTLQVGNGTSGSIANTASVALDVAASTLRFEPSTVTTFSKVISGLGKLEKAGADLFLTAANTYTGGTTVETGFLMIGYNGTTGSIAGNVSVASGANLRFRRTDNITFSGVISGAGNVSQYGTGVLTLNAANTYTGNTTISGGTLALGASGTIAASSGVTLSNAAAKFDISAGNKTIKRLNSSQANAEVILGVRTLTIGTSGQADGGGSYAGKITGTAAAVINALVKYGTETLTLTGTSTYSGRNNFMQGVVEFNSLDNFGTSTLVNGVGGSYTLRWLAGNTADVSARFEAIGGPITFDVQSNAVNFVSALPNTTSAIHKTGSGILYVRAANTFTAPFYIDEGSVVLQGAGALATQSIINSGSLQFAQVGTDYTYGGVISGSGSVSVWSGHTVTLTGANTYTGSTSVSGNNTLCIGSGGTTGSIVSDVNVEEVGILRFNRSNAYTYAGAISGAGNVMNNGAGTLTLNGANTYAGLTAVNAGTLELGASGTIENSTAVALLSGTSKFKITSDKKINGLLTAANSEVQLGGNLTIFDDAAALAADNYQNVNGVISGAGGIIKTGAGKLNLNSANTYTGVTTVNSGTLVLGASGTIANSSGVELGRIMIIPTPYGKLDVSAGNKTIKGLSAGYANNEVILGATTLQIGTSAVVAEGGGEMKGKFTGTGSVAKTGLLPLTMSGANTATGTFTLSTGTLELASNWAGNFAQATGTTFDVSGNVAIGGTLTLLGGGNIAMDLTAAVPSKITVTGNLAASGTTTLNIAANAGNGQVLLTAASGVSASPFTLNMPGFTANLSATATALSLNATVTDNTAPTVGTALAAGTATTETVPLTWGAASDNQTAAANLRYFVYLSASNNISSVANCEANGTLLNAGGALNLTSYSAAGLTPNTAYYFNVVVQDQAGNKTAYTAVSATTAKATLGGTVTITGSAVFGQTLTAVTTGLTSTPTIADLGAITYQWKRGATNIGTNSATYTLVQADIANTITVTVTAANTQGNVVSAPTAAVTKAAQTAPAAPALLSKTHNSITLNTIAGCEYRLSTGTWQASNVFNGLLPETSYYFYARKAETASLLASPESPVSAEIITNAAPIPDKVYQGIQAVPAVNAAYNSPKTAAGLGLPATVTISTDQGNVTGVAITWDVAAANYTVGADPEQTFSVTGTITLPAGVVNTSSLSLNTSVTVTVAARPLVPAVTNVAVSPSSVSVQKGNSQQFAATVTAIDGADESVTWSVIGANNAGTTISTAGNLTIAAAETASTITVRATSVFNSAIFGTATVTVTDVPITPEVQSVSVSPGTMTIEKGQSYQFTATVTAVGGASTSVMWSVTGANNAATTISIDGTLTVAAEETAGAITVRATSVFNSAIFGTATVTLTDILVTPEVLDVTLSTNLVALLAGDTYDFDVNVTTVGGADETVTWHVVGNTSPNTTIDQNGLLTVDESEPSGTLTVRVISVFNSTKFDEATVTVSTTPITPQVNSVSINPSSAEVTQGHYFQFTAIVDAVGGATTAVDWSVEGAASPNTVIDASGLLTIGSDESAASITVKAVSQFNAAVFDEVSVNIITTGINSLVLSKLLIYPNPCVTSIIVENAEGSELRVVSLKGEIVGYHNIISNTQEISVANLAKGIYLFHLVKNGTTQISKVVKN